MAASSAQKALNVAVGALERCSKEYRLYEDEKAELDETVQNISLNIDMPADQRAHQLKKTNEQIQETNLCLQDVGNNVQRFYEKVRAMRNEITNSDAKVIHRVNKAMEEASGMLGETWDPVECEEKKMDLDDQELEFQQADLEELTVEEVSKWDYKNVADYLKAQGYDDAANRAVQKEVTGDLFLEMTRGTVTSELGVATSAERTKLLRQLDRIKGILHTDFVYGLALHKDTVLSCSTDGTVRSWTQKDGKLNCSGVLKLRGSVTALAIRENLLGCVVDTGAGDHLQLIDLMSLKVVHRIEGFKKKVICMEISHDGKFVATGGEGGEICVFLTQSGNEYTRLEGHRKNVMGLAWSPNDKQLAAASQDRIRQVRVWNVAEAKLMVKIKCKSLAYNVHWIVDNKDERLVVGEQKAIGVYDIETGGLVFAIPTDNPVWATAVDPKTLNIAAGLANSRINIYNKEGKEIVTFAGHQANIRALVFGDGYLFSASNDRSVRSWKLGE